MQTKVENIYAAGDLIEHNKRFYGIWPAAMEQGRIAGLNMAGEETKYSGTVLSNTLKVVGIDLTSTGEIDADNKYESIIVNDKEKNIYRKLVIDDNKIIGTILFGDISRNTEILKLISDKTDISSVKDELKNINFNFDLL